MGTKFADFMYGIEAEAIAEGSHAVRELSEWRDYFRKTLAANSIGDTMSSAVYGFIFDGDDWRVSNADDWVFDIVQLEGNEKLLGHKKIDGSICKILQTSDGTLVAITK